MPFIGWQRRRGSIHVRGLALGVFTVAMLIPQLVHAACADTVLVRAAKTYSITGGSPVTFWEPCSLTAVPGRRFLIEVYRPGSSNPLTSARVAYGGVEYFGTSDLSTTNQLISRVVTPQGIAYLKVTLQGSAGGKIVLRATQVPEPLYAIYTAGNLTGNSNNSSSKTYTKNFSFEDGTPPGPWVMRITNGGLDSTGAARTTNSLIYFNSGVVVSSGQLNSGVASLTKAITVHDVNTLEVTIPSGNSGKKLSVEINATDNSPPTVSVTSPTDSLITSASSVSTSATVADAETGVRLFLDGQEKTLTWGTWSSSLSLPSDGKTTFTFVGQNGACLVDTVRRTVIRDSRASTLTVSSPTNGQELASGSTSVTISGQFCDSTKTTIVVEGDTVGVYVPQGTTPISFSKTVPVDIGSTSLSIRAIDAAGNIASVSLKVHVPQALGALRGSTFASTGVAPVGIPTFRSQIGFIYNTTSNPLQVGADTTRIANGSEAVIRGVVATRDFDGLRNVRVSILNHPEYGFAISRADGQFDMVVTGAAQYLLRFYLPGYLEAQRSIWAPTLDYAVMDTVALVGRSSTGVLTDTSQTKMITGKLEADLNNDRRVYALFPHGALATITPDSGASVTLSTYRVRIKEFTVGGDGQNSMPGQLPSTTAYTYCADLSLKEADDIADALGPLHPAPPIVFSKPIVTYVREFLGVPVGTVIPSGYYDPGTGKWVPDEDGRVIKVLSVVGGVANLDMDGNNVADADSQYVAAGVDTLERTQIASQFRIGDVLWRDRVTHFSAHDFNLNMGQIFGLGTPTGGDAGPSTLLIGDPSQSCGCVIENENRVLGESIPTKGTLFSLNYRSSRQFGDKASRWIRIPLTGTTVPSGLTTAKLVVTVAGRQYKQTYVGIGVNDTRVFTDWDGTDAYGRRVPGSVTATVNVGYVFDQSYSLTGSGSHTFGNRASIGTAPALATTGNRSNGYIDWHTYKVAVGTPSMASAGLGGWTITPHHFLDTNGGGALYMGDGSVRYGAAQYPTIRTFAGTGQDATGFPDTSTSAALRTLDNINPSAMAFGPDGSLYFVGKVGTSSVMVFRIKPDGVVHPWVGCQSCPTGIVTNYPVDGGFALDPDKRLASPTALAVGPDGSLFVLDEGWRQVYRISPDDSVHVVMGSYPLGLGAFQDGAIAKPRALRSPSALAVGPEGDVYIADSGWKRVIRIGSDGTTHAFAGDSCCVIATEGKADSLELQTTMTGLAADAAGNVFIAEGPRLWLVTPDGRMRTTLGPDHGIGRISSGADGALYICGQGSYSGILRRAGDGTLSVVAGLHPDVIGNDYTRANFSAEEGGYAAAARLEGLEDVRLGPDGKIYVSQNGIGIGNIGSGIRRIGTEDPYVKSDELYYPSEDGREVYVFTREGRHLRTVNVTTGVTEYAFAYDAGGRLTRITAADSNKVTIQRTSGGAPIAIVGPFGQRTKLSLDGNGYLSAVTDSLGAESYTLSSSSDGLLQGLTDPLDNQDVYTYDSGDGRLYTDRDAALATQTFQQATTGAMQSVTRTTDNGRVTTYQITRMLDGLRRRLVNQLGGAWTYRADSMNTATAPFGNVKREQGVAGDVTLTYPQREQRYGVLAEIPATTYSILPSGTQRTMTASRDTLTSGVITERNGINGSIFTNTYTASTRVLTTTTPEERSSAVTYDAMGRPTSVSIGSNIASVSFHYDANGHLDRLEQGGRGYRYSYDGLGRLRVARDTLGRMVTYDYNPGDRVISQLLPGGRTVSFGVNPNGGLDTLVAPGNKLHRFSYTALDQISGYTPPAVGGAADNPTQYEYNADRQLTKVTRPDGQLIVARYSASSGRLDSLMQARGKTAFTYLSSGQVSSVSSPDGITLDYGYDGPVHRSEAWVGLRGSGSVDSISTRVNISFQDSVETLNGNSPVSLGYDDDGLLTSVTVNGSTESITRRAGDGLLSGTSTGGVTSTLSYDNHGDLWKLRYDWTGGGSFQQVLDRDSLGRIVQVTESGITSDTSYFHYDAAGRMDSVAVHGAHWAGYTYDANGNRVAARGATAADTVTAAYDAQDRMVRYGNRAYTYTAAGELNARVGGPADTLRTTYDALGNLIGAHSPNGDTLVYLVDGANRRVARLVNGHARSSWLYTNEIFLVAELDSTGAVRNRYAYGTNEHAPDLMVQGGITYRIITDQLGSVRAVVDASTGAIAQRSDYDPWGDITTDTAPGFQSLGYAGGLQDRKTKLVRFGARDYDPVVGRWTSREQSLTVAGGEFNVYSYCWSSPIDHYDPDGRVPRIMGRFGLETEALRDFAEQLPWLDGPSPVLDIAALAILTGLLGYEVYQCARYETGQRNYLNDDARRHSPGDPCKWLRAELAKEPRGTKRWKELLQALKADKCEYKKDRGSGR